MSEETALEYAKKVNASHFYTSAKANKNVEEAFMDLAKSILQKKLESRIAEPSPSQDKIIRFDSFKQDQQVDSRIHASGSSGNGIKVVPDNDPKPGNAGSSGPCC